MTAEGRAFVRLPTVQNQAAVRAELADFGSQSLNHELAGKGVRVQGSPAGSNGDRVLEYRRNLLASSRLSHTGAVTANAAYGSNSDSGCRTEK